MLQIVKVNQRLCQLITPLLVASMAALTLPSIAVASALTPRTIPGLAHCAESRSCDIKNANLHFINYTSVCSLADCNFTAAANYDKIVSGKEPSAGLLK